MKKKSAAVLLAVVLGVMSLAGCSGGGSSSEETKATEAAEETKEAEDTDAAEETEEPETAGKTEEAAEPVEVYAFVAASLKNSMEEIAEIYKQDHENVTLLFNADSSGTLQTQIEEGAECDLFFSAAKKQMTALDEGGYIEEGSIRELLENKIVLIKPAGAETAVTGFENITEASSLALAGEDVPVGQYARELFTNIGILDDVNAMEINEGANVTAVLTAVAEGSNEVGVVYATDAASMADSVEIIDEAAAEEVSPAIYPAGLVKNGEADDAQKAAAQEFLTYLAEDEAAAEVFRKAGFLVIAE